MKSKFKKICSLILSVMMICSLITVPAAAKYDGTISSETITVYVLGKDGTTTKELATYTVDRDNETYVDENGEQIPGVYSTEDGSIETNWPGSVGLLYTGSDNGKFARGAIVTKYINVAELATALFAGYDSSTCMLKFTTPELSSSYVTYYGDKIDNWSAIYNIPSSQEGYIIDASKEYVSNYNWLQACAENGNTSNNVNVNDYSDGVTVPTILAIKSYNERLSRISGLTSDTLQDKLIEVGNSVDMANSPRLFSGMDTDVTNYIYGNTGYNSQKGISQITIIPQYYNITVNGTSVADGETTITSNNATVKMSDDYFKGRESETIKFTVTPDDGYSVDSVKVGTATLTPDANGDYSFTMDGDDEDIIVTTSEANATHIKNATEFISFATSVTNGNDYSGQIVKLDADIDLSNSTFSGVGSSTKKFAGTFDGQGHTIEGINIASTNAITGMFPSTTNTAVIKNFTAKGSVNCTAAMPSYGAVLYGIGGIVGVNRGTVSGIISEITVTTTAALSTGGIVGFNAGAINAAGTTQYANAIVTAENGGKGIVSNCIMNGEVTGYHVAGGIAGENAGTIDSCLTFGDVSLTYSSKSGCGGIAGRNGCNNTAYETGVITNCAVYGDVDSGGSYWIGGIAGFSSAIYGKADATVSTVKNCYMVGTKGTAGSYNNAIVGNIDGTAAKNLENKENNYSLSTLSNTGSTEAEKGIQKAKTWFTTTDAAIALSLGSRWVFAESTDPVYSILSSNGFAGYPVPVGLTSNSATVSGVEWSGEPKLEYTAGQSFDMGTLALLTTYSDGTAIKDTLTADKTVITEEDNGKTVTISNASGTSKTYTLSVTADSVNSISITTAPSNVTYAQNENFDATGMVVKAYYSSAPSTAVTLDSSDYTVTQDWANSKVTVSYTFNGKTVTIDQPVTLLSINVPTLSSGYYQIGSAEDLFWFANKVNTGSTTIKGKLTADITVGKISGYKPIGMGKIYTGTFDGNSHTVTMATNATQSGYGSMFNNVGSGATIKNINFVGEISGTAMYNAPIGQITSATINNVTSNLTVNGSTYTSALIGQMTSGTVSDCVVAGGTVTGTGTYTAGLIAMMKAGTVTNCGNNATVTGTTASANIGGLIGAVTSATAAVTVSKCYNKGDITSSKAASTTVGKGGLVGTAKSATAALVKFNDCYNAGNVSAYNCVGGFVGYAYGYSSSKTLTFTNCYNTGAVTNKAGSVTTYTGSFVGYAATGTNGKYVKCDNCYSLSTACTSLYGSSSTATTFTKPTSKTDAEMKDSAFVTTLGETSYKANASGYPLLSWEPDEVPACTHSNAVKTTAVVATCLKAGNSSYWYCPDCEKYFSDSNFETEIEKDSWVIKATGHKLTKHSAVAATYSQSGTKEYYSCSGCNKKFSDADGTTEVTDDSLVIPALKCIVTVSSQNCTIEGGGEYDYGDTVRAIAKNVEGYTFDGWYSGSTLASSNLVYEFKATTSVSLVARYTANQEAVSLQVAEGSGKIIIKNNTQSTNSTVDATSETGNNSVKIGDVVTVSPEQSENKIFVGWFDGNNNKLSTKENYTFTVKRGSTIKPKYLAPAESQAAVVFGTNINSVSSKTIDDSILGSGVYTTDENSTTETYVGDVASTQPVIPSYVGYKFVGYVITISGSSYSNEIGLESDNAVSVDALKDAIKTASNSKTQAIVKVTAKYTKLSDTYKVTMSYKSGDTDIAPADAFTKNYGYSRAITLTANESYKVGDKTYYLTGFTACGKTYEGVSKVTVYPTATDVTDGVLNVVANYAEEEAAPQAIVAITSHTKTTINGVPKIDTVMAYSLPEGCTVLDAGIAYSISSDTFDSMIKAPMNDLSKLDTTYIYHLGVKGYEDTNVYFRGYVIYQDADGQAHTLYTDAVSGSWNSID